MPVNDQERPGLREPVEPTREDIEKMHRHMVDFLREQAMAGASDLVEIGYPEVVVEDIARSDISVEETPEEIEPAPKAARRPAPATPAAGKDKRPKPRSRGDWIARDMASGSSRKPFPYGTKED